MGSCGWVENGASSPACDWLIVALLLLVIFRLTNGYCEFQRHNDMRDAGDLASAVHFTSDLVDMMKRVSRKSINALVCDELIELRGYWRWLEW
ncbi:hypothetical protein BKA58DRAFT_386551 [Alternaria rosae]|uniref:uncharacterized protein n=1 Tax=Alternaria rosae TaxID=1187941 RepID=UPI001E8E4750|nr:uncharacterized protein BKA58DRAFT_386551 [Alternaria rosae]KAH6868255.1 hypothetical protein BKA58DRAFT_386551 [Alternaria rosae]